MSTRAYCTNCGVALDVGGGCGRCKPTKDESLCACGHPVSHHRTGARNQYNADQSRCAYKAAPDDAECPCQLHRAAALASTSGTM